MTNEVSVSTFCHQYFCRRLASTSICVHCWSWNVPRSLFDCSNWVYQARHRHSPSTLPILIHLLYGWLHVFKGDGRELAIKKKNQRRLTLNTLPHSWSLRWPLSAICYPISSRFYETYFSSCSPFQSDISREWKLQRYCCRCSEQIHLSIEIWKSNPFPTN